MQLKDINIDKQKHISSDFISLGQCLWLFVCGKKVLYLWVNVFLHSVHVYPALLMHVEF